MTTVRQVTNQPATNVLADALAGDRHAWQQIVDENSRLLWWIARSHRLDDSTAADVVQTVWLQLLRFGSRIEDPNKLSAWLATTARREAWRRRSSRDIPSTLVLDDADRSTPSTEERIVDKETVGIVLAALDRLSDEDKNLLRLVCDVPPKTYEEIAALLGKPHGYIGPTRQRALRRLRSVIKEMGLS